MRIFVISDTHVPERLRSLPDEIMERIMHGDVLFHCGDFTSIKLFEILKKHPRFYGVLGNMDEFALRSAVPEKQIVEISGKKVGITHGSGSPSGLEQRVYSSFEEKPDIILFGHSHNPYHKFLNNTLMFNPGSFTGGWNSEPTYGELFIEGDKIWGEHHEIDIW